MQPPPLSSGPNHVWVYLANLLITKYNVAGKRAIEIAVKWELGGGSDLRYSHITEINYFEGLFGKDFGYFLFRGLREDLRDEFYSGYWGWFLHWLPTLSIILTLFYLARGISMGVRGIRFAGYAALSFGPPMLICGIFDDFSEYQEPKVGFGFMVSAVISIVYFILFIEPYMPEEGRR